MRISERVDRLVEALDERDRKARADAARKERVRPSHESSLSSLRLLA